MSRASNFGSLTHPDACVPWLLLLLAMLHVHRAAAALVAVAVEDREARVHLLPRPHIPTPQTRQGCIHSIQRPPAARGDVVDERRRAERQHRAAHVDTPPVHRRIPPEVAVLDGHAQNATAATADTSATSSIAPPATPWPSAVLTIRRCPSFAVSVVVVAVACLGVVLDEDAAAHRSQPLHEGDVLQSHVHRRLRFVSSSRSSRCSGSSCCSMGDAQQAKALRAVEDRGEGEADPFEVPQGLRDRKRE